MPPYDSGNPPWVPPFPSWGTHPVRRPEPATTLWPWPGYRGRPEVIVDRHRVLLADPAGNPVGFDHDRAHTGSMGRTVRAGRTPATRAL